MKKQNIKDDDIVKSILHIFSTKNANYWSMSPVTRYTQVEEICFNLIFRKRYDPKYVATLLRRSANKLNTVIKSGNKLSDNYDIKYYGLNTRRLANYISCQGLDWTPKYYRF